MNLTTAPPRRRTTMPLVPFLESVNDAESELGTALTCIALDDRMNYAFGLVSGYLLAGAISELEQSAALELLNRTYRRRKRQLTVQA